MVNRRKSLQIEEQTRKFHDILNHKTLDFRELRNMNNSGGNVRYDDWETGGGVCGEGLAKTHFKPACCTASPDYEGTHGQRGNCWSCGGPNGGGSLATTFLATTFEG